MESNDRVSLWVSAIKSVAKAQGKTDRQAAEEIMDCFKREAAKINRQEASGLPVSQFGSLEYDPRNDPTVLS